MRISIIKVILVVLLFSIPVFAQEFRYVQSQRILAESQEMVDVQNKLIEIRNAYDAEYQKMVADYKVLLEDLDSQSLLLSPEKKQERIKEAQRREEEIRRYEYEKLGPQGDLYKKQQEFSAPIIQKINDLIAKISEEEGYDFVFDASSGALVHSLPKYDITEQIIERLNKGSSSTATGTK